MWPFSPEKKAKPEPRKGISREYLEFLLQEQDCHQAEDYGACEDECHRLPLGMLQAGCQQGKPVDIFGGEMRW